MNNLATLPKNRGLSKQNTLSRFPSVSSWFDDALFGELPSVFSTNFNTGMSLPKVNIKENEDAFIVEMAVPGLKKSDFKIDLDNKVLSISTEFEDKKEDESEGYTRREFGYASFKRTFTMPESVDEEKIKATYNEGILNVNLPKKEEAKQKPARAIKIS